MTAQCVLPLYVRTRKSHENCHISVEKQALIVEVKEAPVDGAANDQIRYLLSRLFHVPLSSLDIIAGEKSKQKKICIQWQGKKQEIEKIKINLMNILEGLLKQNVGNKDDDQ